MTTFIFPEEPTPQYGHQTWVHWNPETTPDEVLSPVECKEFIRLAEEVGARPGTIVGEDHLSQEGTQDDRIRHVQVHDVWRTEDSALLIDKILGAALRANRQWWRFDLTHLHVVQVLRYQPGCHYVEHVDLGPGHQNRKLSIVIQLSDPSDYEGGDLEMIHGFEDRGFAPKGQGSIVVFPAWLMHKVHPVTSGERWCAVAWVEGPPFR